MCGSYEALQGGLTSEALTDFTGGITERIVIKDETIKNLFKTCYKAQRKGALMGCSIDVRIKFKKLYKVDLNISEFSYISLQVGHG